MADTTLPGVLDTGTHAARPAATAVAIGTIYACSDHALVYQSDGATWSTWASMTGTGAATSEPFVTTAASGGLSAEKVRSELKSYHPDNAPTAGTHASSDEFDDSSLHADWTWTTAPGGTVSETAFVGFLHIDGGTDASNTIRYLRRTYAPGAATAFSLACKVTTAAENGNFYSQAGIAVLTSADAVIAQIYVASDGTATGMKNYRLYSGSSSPTQFATEIFDSPISGAPRYFLLTRNASDVYRFYFSFDGMPGSFQYMGTITSATTVDKIGISYAADTDAIAEQASWDWVRVYTSELTTQKIGA